MQTVVLQIHFVHTALCYPSNPPKLVMAEIVSLVDQPPRGSDPSDSGSPSSGSSSESDDDNDDDDPSQWGTSAPCLRNIDETLRCPICKDLCKVTLRGKCGHFFCSECIRRFLRNYKQSCPECRKDMNQAELTNDAVIDKLIASFRASRTALLDIVRTDPSLFASVPSNEDSTRASVSTDSCADSKQKVPMPTLTYRLFTEKKLKGMLKDLNLPISGKKRDWINLHAEYTLQHNIACDSPGPIDPKDVARRALENHHRLHPQAKGSAASFFGATKRSRTSTRQHSFLAHAESNSVQQELINQVRGRRRPDLGVAGSSAGKASLKAHIRAPVWRSVFSERAGRPFYYNTETGFGQFDVPAELDISSVLQDKEKLNTPYLICIDPRGLGSSKSRSSAGVAQRQNAKLQLQETQVERQSNAAEAETVAEAAKIPEASVVVEESAVVERPAKGESGSERGPVSSPLGSPRCEATSASSSAVPSRSASQQSPAPKSSPDSRERGAAKRKQQDRIAAGSKAARLERREKKKWAREMEQVSVLMQLNLTQVRASPRVIWHQLALPLIKSDVAF